MGPWRGKTLEERSTFFFFGALGILAASGGAAYLLAQTRLGPQWAFFLALSAGGVAVLVFCSRVFYDEWQRREHWLANEGDYILTRRERVRSALGGGALMGGAYLVWWIAGGFGVEGGLATLIFWIPGFPAAALLWRALWGVDQNDTDGLD